MFRYPKDKTDYRHAPNFSNQNAHDYLFPCTVSLIVHLVRSTKPSANSIVNELTQWLSCSWNQFTKWLHNVAALVEKNPRSADIIIALN